MNEVDMKRLLIVIATIFFLCPATSFAAGYCGSWGKTGGGSSPWKVSSDAGGTPSVTLADINACINTHSFAGDTINVPAGSATWSSTININKQISLIGAGIGNTIITNGTSGFLIAYSAGNNNNLFRVSGFSFNLNNRQGISLNNDRTLPVLKMVRIDHNRFYNSTFSGAAIENWSVWGVIDHNTFDTMKYPIRLGWGNDSNGGLWNWDNLNPAMYGTDENIYFENNILTDVSTTITDCGEGGRWLMRYNSFSANIDMYPWSDMHSWQDSSDHACMGGELYGNTFNRAGSTVAWRGGRAMMHHNVSPGGAFYIYNNNGSCPTGIDTRELHNNGYSFLNRESTTGALLGQDLGPNNCNDMTLDVHYWIDEMTFNGTTGIGAGTLENRPATCTTGVGYWATNQSTTNLTGMVGVDPDTPISGTFYKCTAINTWTEFYTPYTFPHPLTTREPPPPDLKKPNPPLNVQVN